MRLQLLLCCVALHVSAFGGSAISTDPRTTQAISTPSTPPARVIVRPRYWQGRDDSSSENAPALNSTAGMRWSLKSAFKKFAKTVVGWSGTVSNALTSSVVKEARTLANSVSDGLKEVGNDVADGFCAVVDDVVQYTETAVSEIEDLATQFAADAAAFGKYIANMLKGLGCNIKPSKLASIVTNVSPQFLNQLASLSEHANSIRIASATAQVACVTIWTLLDTQIMGQLITLLRLLSTACPALSSSFNPAMGISVGLSATATSGASTSVGAGLGIAFDIQGHKMCYVETCLESGVAIAIPSAAGHFEFTATFFKSPKSIAGKSKGLSFSVSASIPGIPLDVGVGLEYGYGKSLTRASDFQSVSISGYAGIETPIQLPVTAELKASTCYSWCVSTDRGNCDWSSSTSSSTGTSSSVTSSLQSEKMCSYEDGPCYCNGTVTYGANGNWVSKTVTNSTACTNSNFGADPATGVVKSCFCNQFEDTSSCASESGTCSCFGTVSYGVTGYWKSKTSTSSLSCTNSVFGDPRSGVAKNCYCTPPPSSQSCAAEGGVCLCYGMVLYGANKKFYSRNSNITTDTCSYDGSFHDFGGTVVSQAAITGDDDTAKDSACCTLCSETATCEFWVRNSTTCSLKKGFSGFTSSTVMRGNFKLGSVPCTSELFGDPISGTTKACYCNRFPHTTACASEGASCSCAGNVFYGAESSVGTGKWYQAVSTSSLTCSNSVFGDPYGGVVKRCYCESASS